MRWYFWQDTVHSPAENMAVDEALLQHATDFGCVLRFYGWDRPAFSIGYFQPAAATPPGEYTVVRRPSGGGVVDHRDDLTFSLVFAKATELFQVDRFECYRRINQTVADALTALGTECRLHDREIPREVDRRFLECFQTPARFDVMATDGAKLCGGAQRRRAHGMLHQGSIQNAGRMGLARELLEPELVQSFCALLDGSPEEFRFPSGLAEEVRTAAARYAGDRWTERR